MEVKNLVEDIVEDIRTMLNIKDDRTENIEKIIDSINGRIEEDDINKKCSLIKEGDAFVIRLESKLSDKEKRLWISFELGNLFMHMGYLIDKDKWKKYDDGEVCTNNSQELDVISMIFAMAFIMPKSAFIAKMKDNYIGDGIYDIKSVADYFNLDEDIVVIRGRNLGLLARGESK